MKQKQIFLILFLYSIQIWAASDETGIIIDSGPEPPPAAPIDNYLIYTITICVVFVAYYFYKSNKKPFLKGEN